MKNMRTRSFNPTQNLMCHLCGEIYTEEEGHSYVVCEDILLKRLTKLRIELANTERQRERASLARQLFSDRH